MNAYQTYPQLTTAQTRDRVMLQRGGDPYEVMQEYRAEKARRSKDGSYVECPRCREHHQTQGTYQGVCPLCRLTLLDSFPNHPFTLAMEKHDGFVRA